MTKKTSRFSLPLRDFTKKEWLLWMISLLVVTLSNVLNKEFDLLTLIAALVGVTSLVFAAKGNGWAQVLIVIFSVLYGLISYRFHYYGEMVTYMGMTLPMGVWSAIEWFRHPSKEKSNEVQVSKMTPLKWILTVVLSILVTILFYFILKYFHTPNLIFSTISITTSFIAAMLTILRTSYYALFYAMNDIVLIVLWILATRENPVYFPVIINFVIFLINDLYGFFSWKIREKRIFK